MNTREREGQRERGSGRERESLGRVIRATLYFNLLRNIVALLQSSTHAYFAQHVAPSCNTGGNTRDKTFPLAAHDKNVALQVERKCWPEYSVLIKAVILGDKSPRLNLILVQYLCLIKWNRLKLNGGKIA